jgi:S-adenosyl-L-methionine hydrolase (adenosine-forming)
VAPLITFLSDYGLDDPFVGICHGVIAGICPEARVIDLAHGVPRHDVRAGALMLDAALPFTPAGVHLAVVDPEVGAQRRAIALRTGDGRTLVGPDNGLLMPAGERLGGVVEAVEISHSPLRLEPVSATFHGRDIFAPLAAHLAAGTDLAEAGTPLAIDELVGLELPVARREGDSLVVHAVYVDRFGNVALNLGHGELAGSGLRLGHRLRLRFGGRDHEAQYARTFADVPAGRLLVYEDAERRLAIALSSGDAAAGLGIGPGDELRIDPA